MWKQGGRGGVDILKFSSSRMYGRRQVRSGECIGQVQVRATPILYLVIIFLKSRHHTLKAFWRTRERLLQDRFKMSHHRKPRNAIKQNPEDVEWNRNETPLGTTRLKEVFN